MRGRWTARPEGGFVVFVIGMRINQWWMVHRWLPLVFAMSGMIRELSMRPELGFLGGKTWFGRTIVLVQYWRSFEDLEAYAKAAELSHVPAWAKFNRLIGNDGTVGIYHESYRIGPGQYENVFVNMPPTLLGDCATLVEAKGRLATAAGRMAAACPAAVAERILPEGVIANDHNPRNAGSDCIVPLDPRHALSASAAQPANSAARCQPGSVNVKSRERQSTTDLIALVGQALAEADARGLAAVGIDLCSALERLKCIDAQPAHKARDHQ
jgi:hypothetical protein